MTTTNCGVDENTCHTSNQCGYFNGQCICNDPPGCIFPYPPPCTPNWQCEVPSNCYEYDGCGNRRENTNCCPLVTHKECQSGNCVDITGTGTDQCTTNTNCRHKECRNQVCTELLTPGTDTCVADTECVDVEDPVDWSQYIIYVIIGLAILAIVYYYYTK